MICTVYGVRLKHAYLLCFIKVVSGNGVLNSFDSRTAQSSPNRRSMHIYFILVLFSFFYFPPHSTPFLIFYLFVHVESTTRERRDFFCNFFFIIWLLQKPISLFRPSSDTLSDCFRQFCEQPRLQSHVLDRRQWCFENRFFEQINYCQQIRETEIFIRTISHNNVGSV